MDPGAEQVDSLSAGDFAVEAELLRDPPQHHQFLGRDLPAGHTWHDRVRAVLLHVGEEVIVGILQRGALAREHELIPAGGEDRADRRFAEVAAQSTAMFFQGRGEGAQSTDADQGKQLLARVGEVLAQVIVH